MDISRMHRVACALYLTNPPDYGLLNMRARAVSLPAALASERASELSGRNGAAHRDQENAEIKEYPCRVLFSVVLAV